MMPQKKAKNRTSHCVFSFQFFLTHQFKKKKRKERQEKKVEQEDVRISRSEIKAIELVLSHSSGRMKYLVLQTIKYKSCHFRAST